MSNNQNSSAVSLSLDSEVLAREYERISADRQFRAGQALIRELTIAPGDTVLDIGCGTGMLAAWVADLVGDTGSVIGIDPLPLRIEIAKQKSRANLSFKVGDASHLDDFPSDSFDVVYLNAVLHWLLEKLGPLRQIFRVMRCGGRLGLSTGLAGERNRLQEIKTKVLSREPYNRYPEGLDGKPHWISAEELRELLVASGFAITKIESRLHVQEFPGAEAAIAFAEASSFGNFLGHLPAAIRGQARAAIIRELEREVPAGGIRRERKRILAIAVKP
jgi:arsenite methyltransferase